MGIVGLGSTPQSEENETARALARASRISVWLPWYFKQGIFTLVTVPLFLVLVYFALNSAVAAAFQGLALVRVARAVFGFIGVLLTLCFGWIPVIIPPILYYSVLKNLPGLWLRPDASTRHKIIFSLIVLILWPLAADVISYGVGYAIGWIADHDPCAALGAGVTGSKVATSCK